MSLLDDCTRPVRPAATRWCVLGRRGSPGNDWLAQAANWLIAKPLAILVLVLLALGVRWFLHRVIDRLVAPRRRGAAEPGAAAAARARRRSSSPRRCSAGRRVQRAETMGTLLKSITSIVIFAVVGITAIAELGYNIAPLIASAGIVGVALGFGAQSLVKDFLSGIFMIFEDQYGVGDVVDLGEASGTVEAVGLRVTRLRDVDGTVWYVRNGEILRVGNMSQNWARTVLDIPVASTRTSPASSRCCRTSPTTCGRTRTSSDLIIEEPEVWGVAGRSTPTASPCGSRSRPPRWSSGRSPARCASGSRRRFDHEGIEIPLPQRVVWHRDADRRERQARRMTADDASAVDGSGRRVDGPVRPARRPA